MPHARRTPRDATAGRVTARELTVLRGVTMRLSNAEIADLLGISRRTVESHVSSLLRKFDVRDRRQLGHLHNHVDPPPDTVGGSTAARRVVMPVSIAQLDTLGVIVSVNPAWSRYCSTNGGDPLECGPGSSYLAVCALAGDPASMMMIEHIRTATRGGVFVPLQLRIPCDSPTETCQYDVLVSSRVDDDGVCIGATVSFCQVEAPPR